MNASDPDTALLRLVHGGAVAQSVAVAARLGLADLLAEGPREAAALAAATGTHESSLRRLLRALAALDVVAECEDWRFALGPLGRPLRAGAPGSSFMGTGAAAGAQRNEDEGEHTSKVQPYFSPAGNDDLTGALGEASPDIIGATNTEDVIDGYDPNGFQSPGSTTF